MLEDVCKHPARFLVGHATNERSLEENEVTSVIPMTRVLWELLAGNEILVLRLVYDALSAKIPHRGEVYRVGNSQVG